MTVIRKIIEIDENLCDGCGNCIIACAEGALKIVDGKAKVIADKYCDGLGACLGDCPTGALRVVEREADEFDEEAVEEHLAAQERAKAEAPQAMPCGCPSARIETFTTPSPCAAANEPATMHAADSALTHWPVQIRLVPPNAPFLKGADLLVAADCAGFAHPAFHRDFLAGRILLIGCPKFDEAEAYIEKFAQIFEQADIKSVTTLVMEVPCCSGLPLIVKRGLEKAGKTVPMEQVIIGTQGDVLRKEKLVA